MGRTDSASRNKKRLDGITRVFEVLADGFEGVGLAQPRDRVVIFSEESGLACHVNRLAGLYHREDASNVLANDPSGSDFVNGSDNLRPEVAVIVRSLSLSGD